MLSQSSIKTELIAFRDSMKPARFNKKGELVEPGNPQHTADLQLINRWIERCDRENLEERLRKTLHAMTAPELIRLELLARRKAGAAVNQIYGTKWGAPSFDEVRRILQKRPQIAGGGVLVGLSKEWRDIKKKLTDNLSLANLDILERGHDMHVTYSHLTSDFNDEPRQRDDGGTRLKRLFWDFMEGYLYIRFGKWFDNEVAILTEIAFDLPDGSVSPQHINHARRQR